jgi:hypothetical protein
VAYWHINAENFLGFLVLTLESSIRMMKHGQETWTWLLDMSNYDSRNSPRFDFTVRVLQLVANHYPERLNKVFIVDAPTLFWVLFKVRERQQKQGPARAPRALRLAVVLRLARWRTRTRTPADVRALRAIAALALGHGSLPLCHASPFPPGAVPLP